MPQLVTVRGLPLSLCRTEVIVRAFTDPLMRIRVRRRSFGLQFTVLLILGTVALTRYWYNVGFDQKYRIIIAAELERYGLGAEIGRMTIDPVEGLTARDVRLFDLKFPDQRLAEVSRLSLDIDLGRLVNREDFLRSVTLTRANITMPVDPGDRETEWIRATNLNARLIIKGPVIEIGHAEANLAGIHVNVRGEIMRSVEDSSKKPNWEEEMRKREQQLREMRDRRGALRTVLRLLDRCRIPEDSSGRPLAQRIAAVDVEVHGDLADLDQAVVRATMNGGPLRCGTFEASEYSADVVLENGELTVKRLHAVDSLGTFSASASWRIRQSDQVEFAVDSGIDLLALISGAAPNLALPEEYAFLQSPRIRAEGSLLVNRPFTTEHPPLNITGSLHAGDVRLKGEAYQGLHADFAVREDGFLYLRNVAVQHTSGTLRGQFIRSAEGMRYRLALDSGMALLKPLLGLPALQKPLEPVRWSDTSRLDLQFSGECRPDGRTWNHRGKVNVKEFRLHGELAKQFAADVNIGPGAMPAISIENFRLEREDGIATGKQVIIDQPGQLVHFKEVVSNVMPSPAAQMFAPKTGEALARYYFESPPRAVLNGKTGLRSPEGNNLLVSLESPGICGLPVAQQNWRFTGITGTIHVLSDHVAVDISGRSVPAQKFTSVVRFDSAAQLSIKGRFGTRKENLVSGTSYTVAVDSPPGMALLLGTRELPIDNLDATVRAEGARLNIDTNGELFGGRIGSVVEFPDMLQPRHMASVALDRVNFSKLTALFGSEDNTGGFFSGRISYETPDGQVRAMDGNGAASLEEGNIFALPLLGPLSTLLATIAPGEKLGYSVARNAAASFRMTGGRLITTDFEATTRAFRLMLSGVMDIARNHVDLNARVNLRGAPGLLLYPVSRLLEYEATGTVGDPGWRPKNLPRPFKRGRKNDRDLAPDSAE